MDMIENNDDILLLNLIKQDDEVAFKHLFYKYVDTLERFVFSYVNEREQAQEIVLDLFTYVWAHRSTLQIKLTLKAYLFQSAKNRSLNFLRDRETHLFMDDLQLADSFDNSSWSIETEELHQLIAEAVSLLPEKCRIIFEKSREENLTNKQIAATMNISEKTVENQITIALRKIKVFLGNKYSYLW